MQELSSSRTSMQRLQSILSILSGPRMGSERLQRKMNLPEYGRSTGNEATSWMQKVSLTAVLVEIPEHLQLSELLAASMSMEDKDLLCKPALSSADPSVLSPRSKAGCLADSTRAGNPRLPARCPG